MAALAGDGVWFRNATTVCDYTRWAVPSMLSGQWPRADAAPDGADHPNTLFTLLAPTHRLEVVEPVTHLCPARLCGQSRDSWPVRLDDMAADLWIVYQHVVLTDDVGVNLPSLTDDWAHFGAAGTRMRDRRRQAARRRREISRAVAGNLPMRTALARRFIAGIDERDPQPTFYFLHTMLTHTPHVLLPDGRMNATWAAVPLLKPPRALPGNTAIRGRTTTGWWRRATSGTSCNWSSRTGSWASWSAGSSTPAFTARPWWSSSPITALRFTPGSPGAPTHPRPRRRS